MDKEKGERAKEKGQKDTNSRLFLFLYLLPMESDHKPSISFLHVCFCNDPYRYDLFITHTAFGMPSNRKTRIKGSDGKCVQRRGERSRGRGAEAEEQRKREEVENVEEGGKPTAAFTNPRISGRFRIRTFKFEIFRVAFEFEF